MFSFFFLSAFALMTCTGSAKCKNAQSKKLHALGPVDLKNTKLESLQMIGPICGLVKGAE